VSGERKALIVAVDEYEQEGLRDLLAPAVDAEALGRVLGDPQIGEFAVQVVRNEPAHIIQAQVEELFSESRRDDVLLLHFSGHGLKSESGELFFAASNTRPNRLKSTALSADFVRGCMQTTRSRSVVLLLDCCYGGAFAQGVKVRAAGDVHVLDSFPRDPRSGGGRGRAVITASSAMEFAFEGDQLGDDQHRQPSVFTAALVEGLATGDADRDEDGWVSLNELYDYVFDKVQEQNPNQTPSRQVELEGELYLARSRRRRIRPAPIPPDLQAALADSNMYARLGAISELVTRLTSENLPVAAGAYEALADLARTDIRAVADPAAAALSQAVLRPEETALHFGEHRQGSTPPHRSVRLLGPPIARACAPRASDDWIRVNETAEGFDISVDTAMVGALRGTLDLKGPTGEAVIDVDVELLPQEPQEPLPQEADSTQTRAPVSPRLELSATMVDFGQLSLHSQPPERRVRLGNSGGGSLNAQAVTQADWLKLSQDGDELVIRADTSAIGEHEGAVAVDSDGGSATIRVTVTVQPTQPVQGADQMQDLAHRDSAQAVSADARGRPLVLGPLGITIPLFILALGFLRNFDTALPVWIMLVTAILGAILAGFEIRRDMIWALMLEWNLLLLVLFSVVLLGFQNSSTPPLGLLKAILIIWAIGDAALCVFALILRYVKGWPRVYSILAVFLGSLAVGSGLAFVTLFNHSIGLVRAVGWVVIAAFLANLFTLVAALQAKRSGVGSDQAEKGSTF
jgi:hypothetical protein